MGDAAPSRVRVAWKVGKVIKEKSCLWCGEKFDVRRKRVPLCHGCRVEKNREQQRIRDRQRAEERQFLLNAVLPKVPPEMHQRAYELVDEYLDDRSDDNLPQEMRMPPGYKSERGPWEGQSSFFEDLRGHLKTLANEAAQHPWWRENPPEDVFFELGRMENAKKYFQELAAKRDAEGTACGASKGTQPGYQKHIRAREKPCTPCTRAQAEYFRNYRARKREKAAV